MIALPHYLILSAVIFAIGVIGVLIRRNLIVILMSIELMLNAVNINLVAYSNQLQNAIGQVFAIFVIAVAAAGSFSQSLNYGHLKIFLEPYRAVAAREVTDLALRKALTVPLSLRDRKSTRLNSSH